MSFGPIAFSIPVFQEKNKKHDFPKKNYVLEEMLYRKIPLMRIVVIITNDISKVS